jgi:hypothetical protein
MKYLVYGLDYNVNMGGVVVLHKLADVLSSLNSETYVVCDKTFDESKANVISHSDSYSLASEKDCVVIYPEVVLHNILNAKNVVRWVLYYPGIHGGTKEYSETEHVFLYHKEYGIGTKYVNNIILNIFDTKTNFFYDKKNERHGDCFLIKKGNHKPVDKIEGFYIDEFLHGEFTDLFLLNTFNKYERFISYDVHTYYSIIAAMCGCTSIVIPDLDISPKQYYDNEFVKYGISYGFENEKWSIETKHLVKNHINDIYEKSMKTVVDFHNYCLNTFC